MFSLWAKDFKKHVNQLPLFDQEKSNKAGGDPNIRYYHSYWSLGPDEALVIEATPPACEAWNFQLNNHWMESLDYRYYNIHINGYLATYRADGSVCVVVAHRQPQVQALIGLTRSGTTVSCAGDGSSREAILIRPLSRG